MGRTPSRKVVSLFTEGDTASPTVLGGKGFALAQMTRLGVPVPMGFTVSTSVSRAFNQHGRLPRRLGWQLTRGIEKLERATGQRFGDPHQPLLVSVRSGAPVSMPGMMDTVLNVGLNPDVVREMAKDKSEARFAWDCYRRFLAMFGHVVRGISRTEFDRIFVYWQSEDSNDPADVAWLEMVCEEYRDLIAAQSGTPVPEDPSQQLDQTLAAVFASWDNPRAVAYRTAHGIDPGTGTAANIQAMVFGNRGDDSGTGVVFSRDTATGTPGLWGEFLVNAQGEDVVNGECTPQPIHNMQAWNPTIYAALDRIVHQFEDHYNDVVDVEFTVEQGRLYILQVRVAQRAPEAAATIAVHMEWDLRWTKQEALARVSREHMQALRVSGFNPADLTLATATRCVGRGLPASPGAAVGTVVFSSAEAVTRNKAGEKVVLVVEDTTPDDLPGMLVAEAIVTRNGGVTCHAAVVARGMAKPAVVGCVTLDVSEGAIISVDGQAGVVVTGEVKRDYVADKKECNIFLRWARQFGVLAPEPRLDYAYIDEQVSVHLLINDFYLSDALTHALEGTRLGSRAVTLRDEIHTAVAERLATYLLVAVAGELRHFRGNIPEFQSLQDNYNVMIGGNGERERRRAQCAVIARTSHMSREEQAEFFSLAMSVCDNGSWKTTSHGGKKWAAIAAVAHGFLTGELDHSVFADHAFDLQHNNGSVIGKHDMVFGNGCQVESHLEGKKRAQGVNELVRLASAAGMSESVSELVREWQQQVVARR